MSSSAMLCATPYLEVSKNPCSPCVGQVMVPSNSKTLLPWFVMGMANLSPMLLESWLVVLSLISFWNTMIGTLGFFRWWRMLTYMQVSVSAQPLFRRIVAPCVLLSRIMLAVCSCMTYEALMRSNSQERPRGCLQHRKKVGHGTWGRLIRNRSESASFSTRIAFFSSNWLWFCFKGASWSLGRE